MRGDVAQLGEHLLCKQGVAGSNPVISTTREETARDRITRANDLALGASKEGADRIFDK